MPQSGVKLSVLIPTYNYNCVGLVKALHSQGELLDEAFEVIVADDASTIEDCKVANRKICDLPHCIYWESAENMGRSAIRNRMAEMAKGELLLFIDNDAEVIRDSFLRSYLAVAEKGLALCGSLQNVPRLSSSDKSLRFYYEKEADGKRSAEQRNRLPYHWFTTFNFMIPRSLFFQVRFNEDFVGYGYEDTYFAMDLKKKGIPVKHIDNPLIHLGLDTNDVFLKKTETALHTLFALGEEMHNWVSVSRMANRIKCLHLDGLVRFLHRRLALFERKNLLSAHPSLLVFSLYKLGYYMNIKG